MLRIIMFTEVKDVSKFMEASVGYGEDVFSVTFDTITHFREVPEGDPLTAHNAITIYYSIDDGDYTEEDVVYLGSRFKCEVYEYDMETHLYHKIHDFSEPEPEEEEDDEGYSGNCYCDTYGMCGGPSCPQYMKCQ